MKHLGVRVLLVILAVVALGAAGLAVWRIEQRIADERSAADSFERDARHAVINLGDLRAAQQAYVADGQPTGAWLTDAAAIAEAVGPKLSALRAAAGTVEAQGALEASIEAFTAFRQSDAKARDYVKSGQRLSASDVIFADAARTLTNVVNGIDTARGQESVARAVAIERARRSELIALGAAAAFALLVMLLLVPVPGAQEAEASAETATPRASGLNLSLDLGDSAVRKAQPVADDTLAQAPLGGAAAKPAPTAWRSPGTRPAGARNEDDTLEQIEFGPELRSRAKAPDLAAVAELCSALARVQDTRELQGLLERAAKHLDATGVIIWMPDGPQASLRPVLAHGYAPQTLSRMGLIHPAADNATAAAYRTKSVVVVPTELLSSGALVAPLVTPEGCSGAMAVELRAGVETTPDLRAVATILAAQLATLLTPGATAASAAPSPAGASGPAAVPGGGSAGGKA